MVKILGIEWLIELIFNRARASEILFNSGSKAVLSKLCALTSAQVLLLSFLIHPNVLWLKKL